MSAIGALAAGTAITTFFYFSWVRPLIRNDDNRVAITMMVVGALGLLAILALLVLWYGRDFITLDTRALGTDTLLQAAGVVVTALGRQRAIPPQGEPAAKRERKAAEARKAQFFDRLAKDLGCPEIKEWLK